MKALIALAILGTSSVAVAQPVVRDHRQNDRQIIAESQATVVRDHREPAATRPFFRFGGSAMLDTNLMFVPQGQDPIHDHDHAHGHDCDHDFDDFDDFDDDDELHFRRAIKLASNATFVHDHHDHGVKPMYIRIDGRMRGLTRLRLDRMSGKGYIESIVLMYPNGRSRTVAVRQHLNRRTPSLMIDLDRRAITGVYIYGTATRGRASFDVIGLRR